MTDKEVIKALECCSLIENPNGELKCKQCPFNGIFCGTGKEKTTATKIVLDLINRQQAEIDNLNGELITEKTRRGTAVNSYHEAQAEIERLQMENLMLSQRRTTFPEIIELVNNARTEAIKEFAGKIADVFCSHDKGDAYVREVVYNLVKEMVGEENDNR